MSTVTPQGNTDPLVNRPYFLDGGFPNDVEAINEKLTHYHEEKKHWMLTSKIIDNAAKVILATGIIAGAVGTAAFLITFHWIPLIVVGVGLALLVSYAAYKILSKSNTQDLNAYKYWKNATASLSPEKWNWDAAVKALEKIHKLGPEKGLQPIRNGDLEFTGSENCYEKLRVTAYINDALQKLYCAGTFYLQDPEKYSAARAKYNDNLTYGDIKKGAKRNPPIDICTSYCISIRESALKAKNLFESSQLNLDFDEEGSKNITGLLEFLTRPKGEDNSIETYLAELAGDAAKRSSEVDEENMHNDLVNMKANLSSNRPMPYEVLIEYLTQKAYISGSGTTPGEPFESSE